LAFRSFLADPAGLVAAAPPIASIGLLARFALLGLAGDFPAGGGLPAAAAAAAWIWRSAALASLSIASSAPRFPPSPAPSCPSPCCGAAAAAAAAVGAPFALAAARRSRLLPPAFAPVAAPKAGPPNPARGSVLAAPLPPASSSAFPPSAALRHA
jgi:hypothetical protein